MDQLKERILAEGRITGTDCVRVDSFLNHQVDPALLAAIGREFANRFAADRVTRILTIEASGIAPALFTGLALSVPVVFAKKTPSRNQDESCYQALVHSFTRHSDSVIRVSRRFLSSGDRVLLIDDFLANGQALLGLAEIVAQAGAALVGAGVVIEKGFQEGGSLARDMGIRVEALVTISDLSQGTIRFKE